MGASVSASELSQVTAESAASFSSSAPEANSAFSSSSSSLSSAASFELLELPRDCLVRVLSVLSALDACRMARVCRTLRILVDSDEIWEPRLPSHPAINPPSLSRKDLFFRLRAGMLHKDLSQPYWLDPGTGEGCFVKSARDLTIVWGDTPHYWGWESQPDSWFGESAVLRNVCWFEVSGEFESNFLPGAYTVSFMLKFEHTDRWASARSPVKLSLTTSNGQHVESQRYFFTAPQRPGVLKIAPLRSSTSCSWLELDIGEFVVPREMHVALKFHMMEIEGGQWKSGIILDCVKIQPSGALSQKMYI